MRHFVKGVAVGVGAALLLAGSLSYAQSTRQQIEVQILPLHYIFDGVEKGPPADQQGFVYNNRTYVPLRFIAESMDKDVKWDGTNYTISIGNNSNAGVIQPSPVDTKGEYITAAANKDNLPLTVILDDGIFLRIDRYVRTLEDVLDRVTVQTTIVNNTAGKELILPELDYSQPMKYTHTGEFVKDRVIKAGDSQEITISRTFYKGISKAEFGVGDFTVKSASGSMTRGVAFSLTMYQSTLSSKDDIVKFLYSKFSKAETAMGTAEFRFDVIENTFLNDAPDFTVRVWYDLDFFTRLQYSGAISDETKVKVKRQLKDHQEHLGRALVEAMPTKKFMGGYYYMYYKYPALQMDPVVHQYYKWQNFDDPVYPETGNVSSYKLTKPSVFRWATKMMFDEEL